MEKRVLGRTGMAVSILGLGGAEIGLEQTPQEEVNQLLNAALDAGLNAIDTGECYASGDHPSSEELIGQAIGHRRSEFFLFTKCGHASRFPGETDWTPSLLEKSIDRSLTRLKTDVLDLIQLHSCGENLLRQGDVIAALQKARDAGKARFIGYSGDGQAALYAATCGAFDTLQTSINLADQEAADLTLPHARAANLGVIAKRPVANIAWKDATEPPERAYHHAYWKRLQKLDYPFLNGPDAVSVALRFTLCLPGVHIAIVGTKNPDRWRQNAAVLDAGLLPDSELKAIRDRWHTIAQPDWVGRE
jgi:aryl-alcohol dehydrogenase-like predicted oxidoreductase